ncbi:uncharacterized protein LOC121372528 isoform X2 [Gigantopelta aegis]|uniref:uncharacterized protein LOC121372528 isoform X2 n=1 Tax=Gigantopelta aegis TaxID=1735272 RepID=UPI001B88C219|nr:uncharacterized protein LOC121372528 isoform X2 [Gigantopelta aegis]XP_041354857.1 uncharacterized protein LOC121372528 isoform X2 [Gigantopelta aegis]XP_041354865.1 uncharacterized protein LOC121372528 isoform X2 [Gigantopelta aegis]
MAMNRFLVVCVPLLVMLWMVFITVKVVHPPIDDAKLSQIVTRYSASIDRLFNSRQTLVGKQSRISIAVDPKVNDKSTIAIYRDEVSWNPDTKVCSSKETFRKATLKSASGNIPINVNESPDGISDTVSEDGFFERDLEKPLYKCLDEDKDLVFLDIGANVGVFSLSVAKKGHKVVAVEVLPGNAARLCRSINESGFGDRVTLIHNGLSDKRTLMEIVHKEGVEGGVYIQESLNPEKNTFFSIYLDDLLEVLNLKRVVMKIDVERHEAKILEKADEFFRKVDVTCVMMEWERHPRNPDAYQMMVFMARHHMLAFDPQDTSKSLDAYTFAKWPRNVLWRKVRDYGPWTD